MGFRPFREWIKVSDHPPQFKIRINFHAGQLRVLKSKARYILMLAGRQSGKTVTGPYWLWQEIQKCGPGDYIVAGPSFPLLYKKTIPEFERHFKTEMRAGRFMGKDHHFELNENGARIMWGRIPDEKTKIFFGHADDPESLESATVKAAWLDEAGQKKFKLESYEAVQGRLSIHRGRCLITTTPYSLHYWIKRELYDKAKAGDKDIEVIHFDSIMNPAFSRAEYEKHRNDLPRWKFDLFYRALFTRPAGVIYEAWDEDKYKVPAFTIPLDWPRYCGVDFGGVHTACVFLAAEMINHKETGRFFLYREYPERRLWTTATSKEHAKSILSGESKTPRLWGGAASEDQWRSEFRAAGLPIMEPPIKDVESGIDRVHGLMKAERLFVFDSCSGILDDIGGYSRELDDAGEPTEKIEDKETFHYADALRYVCSYLNGGKKEFWIR